MNMVRTRWMAAGLWAVAMTLLNACTVTGVGVEGSADYGAGYEAGYYEPWGYDYGGWGYGYRVGPGRGGDRRGGAGSRSHRRPRPGVGVRRRVCAPPRKAKQPNCARSRVKIVAERPAWRRKT